VTAHVDGNLLGERRLGKATQRFFKAVPGGRIDEGLTSEEHGARAIARQVRHGRDLQRILPRQWISGSAGRRSRTLRE
jgi:hypothetical protein